MILNDGKDPIVITAEIENFDVKHILIDDGKTHLRVYQSTYQGLRSGYFASNLKKGRLQAHFAKLLPGGTIHRPIMQYSEGR